MRTPATTELYFRITLRLSVLIIVSRLARSRPTIRLAHAWKASATDTDSVTCRRHSSACPSITGLRGHQAAGPDRPQCRLRPTASVRACLRVRSESATLFPLAGPRGRLSTHGVGSPSTPPVRDLLRRAVKSGGHWQSEPRAKCDGCVYLRPSF